MCLSLCLSLCGWWLVWFPYGVCGVCKWVGVSVCPCLCVCVCVCDCSCTFRASVMERELNAMEEDVVRILSNWPWDHKPWAVDTQTQHDAEGSSPQPHSLAAGMEMVESQRMAVKREMMEDEEDEAAAAADKDECVRETSSEDYCSPIVCPAPVMWTGQSHATEIPVADYIINKTRQRLTGLFVKIPLPVVGPFFDSLSGKQLITSEVCPCHSQHPTYRVRHSSRQPHNLKIHMQLLVDGLLWNGCRTKHTDCSQDILYPRFLVGGDDPASVRGMEPTAQCSLVWTPRGWCSSLDDMWEQDVTHLYIFPTIYCTSRHFDQRSGDACFHMVVTTEIMDQRHTFVTTPFAIVAKGGRVATHKTHCVDPPRRETHP